LIKKQILAMRIYYINKKPQNDGFHDIHTSDCSYLPSAEYKEYLGVFDHWKHALKRAKKMYSNANGCPHCLKECHKRN
jgi:hypothetical protein